MKSNSKTIIASLSVIILFGLVFFSSKIQEEIKLTRSINADTANTIQLLANKKRTNQINPPSSPVTPATKPSPPVRSVPQSNVASVPKPPKTILTVAKPDTQTLELDEEEQD